MCSARSLDGRFTAALLDTSSLPTVATIAHLPLAKFCNRSPRILSCRQHASSRNARRACRLFLKLYFRKEQPWRATCIRKRFYEPEYSCTQSRPQRKHCARTGLDRCRHRHRDRYRWCSGSAFASRLSVSSSRRCSMTMWSIILVSPRRARGASGESRRRDRETLKPRWKWRVEETT